MISGRTINGTVLTSGAAIVIGGAVLLLNVPSLLGAMFGRGAGAHDPSATIALLEAEHREEMKLHQERFNGRSLFFRPLPPPPPPPPPRAEAPPPPPKPEPPRVVDTGPPPPPATYGGPAPMNVLGNSVWFRPRNPREPGMRIAVGEEADGIRVIAVHPPWHVELGWERGEYQVPIFTRKEPFFATVDDPHRPMTGLVVSQEALEQAQKEAAQAEAMSRHAAEPRGRAAARRHEPIPPAAAERARLIEEKEVHGYDAPYDPTYDTGGRRDPSSHDEPTDDPKPDEYDPDGTAEEYAAEDDGEELPDEPPVDDPLDEEEKPLEEEDPPADNDESDSDVGMEEESGREYPDAQF